MKLVIVGLRRSGTTIFWETFRQDQRLLCFDEPFNCNLIELPAENSKNTRAEMIRLVEENPDEYWRMFAPIDASEELHPRMSDRQREYLEYLLGRSEHTVFDTTRMAFKLADLHAVDPTVFLIHLHRSPEAFATSHLRPNGSRWIDRIRLAIRAHSFFSRSGSFSNWSVEQVIGTSPLRPFGSLIRKIGCDPDTIYQATAVVKLLMYWRIHYEHVEKDGRRLFGGQFRSVQFEDFCSEPEKMMRECYEWMGLSYPRLDLSRIRNAAGPYSPNDVRWREANRLAGTSFG